MATFPKLRTGAVIQYPATRRARYRNQALRFLDGTEQRYRDSAGPLRRWDIPLTQLDDSEMSALERFFVENQGRLGSFAFIDPWDGREYPSCSLEADGMEATASGEMSVATVFTIVENRG